MKIRQIIFWMHLVIGVIVGTVVLIMATTGTMLAFRPQILHFADRNVRQVVPPAGAKKLSLDILLTKIRESNSDTKLSAVLLESDPTSSVAFSLGRGKTIHLNPYTGEILGQDSKVHDFLEKVEVWHRWLGMEGELKPLGHGIKGVCTIAFFFLIVTGFYLWWPSTWNWSTFKQVTTFNPNVRGKARDWNWHNVIGFWAAPWLIIISLTGVIMSYEWANSLLYKLSGNEPPAAVARPEGKGQQGGEAANIDTLFAQAKQQVPAWVTMNIRLPQRPNAPVTILIQEPQSPLTNARSQLTLDSSTGKVVKWEPFREQNRGRQWRTWARYIHTGEAGGAIGQTIACLAAMSAVMLVWTGLSMGWQRFSSWQQKKLKIRVS